MLAIDVALFLPGTAGNATIRESIRGLKRYLPLSRSQSWQRIVTLNFRSGP